MREPPAVGVTVMSLAELPTPTGLAAVKTWKSPGCRVSAVNGSEAPFDTLGVTVTAAVPSLVTMIWLQPAKVTSPAYDWAVVTVFVRSIVTGVVPTSATRTAPFFA